MKGQAITQGSNESILITNILMHNLVTITSSSLKQPLQILEKECKKVENQRDVERINYRKTKGVRK